VTRALAGDAGAAQELAEKHVRSAWRAAYAVTGRGDLADEAVQDGFERAFGALGSFDSTRPFGPWISRIVINRALTLVGRTRRSVEFDEDVHGAEEGRAESATEVIDALRRLDPDRRVVVVMRLVCGFTPEETASSVASPSGPSIRACTARSSTCGVRWRCRPDEGR